MNFLSLKNKLWKSGIPFQDIQKPNYRMLYRVIVALMKGNFLWARGLTLFSRYLTWEKIYFRGEKFFLITEKEKYFSGGGSYFIRKEGTLILQNLHSFSDLKTDNISLKLFLENQDIRGLWVNTFHRYTQKNGKQVKLFPSNNNLADAAHNVNHPISIVTREVLKDQNLSIIQIHGFKKNEDDPDIIVSGGEKEGTIFSNHIFSKLKNKLEKHWFEIKHYNIGVFKLGATTNIQGRIAHQYGRGFCHLELSLPLRSELDEGLFLLKEFASCLKEKS